MNKFKNAVAVLGVCVGLLAVASSSQAAVGDPYLVYSTSTTNANAALSYAIVGCNSANGGAPVITALEAASDLATAVVQFYKVDAITTVTGPGSTVRIDVTATNGLADNGTIIIRHYTGDTYEKRSLTTSTGSTNLVATVAPFTACVQGDVIYHVTTAGAGTMSLTTNAVAANSMALRLQSKNIYSGQPGLPLLVEVNQTTTGGAIRLVTAEFITTPR